MPLEKECPSPLGLLPHDLILLGCITLREKKSLVVVAFTLPPLYFVGMKW